MYTVTNCLVHALLLVSHRRQPPMRPTRHGPKFSQQWHCQEAGNPAAGQGMQHQHDLPVLAAPGVCPMQFSMSVCCAVLCCGRRWCLRARCTRWIVLTSLTPLSPRVCLSHFRHSCGQKWLFRCVVTITCKHGFCNPDRPNCHAAANPGTPKQ